MMDSAPTNSSTSSSIQEDNHDLFELNPSATNEHVPSDDVSDIGLTDDSTDNLQNGQTSKERQEAYDALARAESRHVCLSRAVFLIVLSAAGAAAATAVYTITKDNEEADFRTRYEDFANQVLEVSQLNADDIFATYESSSLHISSAAEAAGETWPNVTVPKFEALGQYTSRRTGASGLGVVALVSDATKSAYEQYRFEQSDWIQDSLDFAESNMTIRWNPRISNIDSLTGAPTYPEGHELYAPASMLFPIEKLGSYINVDAFMQPYFQRVFDAVKVNNKAVLSEIVNLGTPEQNVSALPRSQWPASYMAAPIYSSVATKSAQRGSPEQELVGLLSSEIPWDSYFHDVVPEGIDGIIMIVRNTCNQTCTYLIEGPTVTYLGVGDRHVTSLDEYEVDDDFTAFVSLDECVYSFHMYPTQEFRDGYDTNAPVINTVAVVAIFLMTAIAFAVYNQLVEKRQSKVMDSATRSQAIVSSLFPANVRDRLMNSENSNGVGGPPVKSTKDKGASGNRLDAFRRMGALATSAATAAAGSSMHAGNTSKAQDFMDSAHNYTDGEDYNRASQPIADFFPNVTVLFADIVGFTAWSSTRDPVEVFTLLETLYNAFDRIAGRLKVFKVETIGDCYVAACGLPEPRDDHAVVMFRFARVCMTKMNDVVHRLATTLGPGTAELSMRFGLHSGPVTAGVLRGQKSRFQLFGDTMNTAARIESTGSPNRIHISKETAQELERHQKSAWLRKREDAVVAKGKGELQTFWGVLPSTQSVSSKMSAAMTIQSKPTELRSSASEAEVQAASELAAQAKTRTEQLISWNVENLQRILRKITATRPTSNGRQQNKRNGQQETNPDQQLQRSSTGSDPRITPLEEVKDVLHFAEQGPTYVQDPRSIQLGPDVTAQLADFVRTVAQFYNDNHFHSFEHASHVVQSVCKLLTRMNTASLSEASAGSSHDARRPSGTDIGTYIHSISSDPLVEFACVFSALIHDVDHFGVPNVTLCEERHELALQYKNKSIAEQHSIDVAWNLLMEPRYQALRSSIYSTTEEMQRFRDLVVSAVIATDIMDKELKSHRHDRWEKAFAASPQGVVGNTLDILLKRDVQGTVVLEHLIQASDVAHTMQHWHVFLKWNEKLFDEMYAAFLKKTGGIDPSEGWYRGELWFFDNYIIPLAEKLKECTVFGVSSDEYLTYAKANRQEWEQKGDAVVKNYLKKFKNNSD